MDTAMPTFWNAYKNYCANCTVDTMHYWHTADTTRLICGVCLHADLNSDCLWMIWNGEA